MYNGSRKGKRYRRPRVLDIYNYCCVYYLDYLDYQLYSLEECKLYYSRAFSYEQ